jgi:hypothetical protein
MTTT